MSVSTLESQRMSLLQIKVNQAMITAPTGDNAQPFFFKWNGFQVDIFVDLNKAEHILNIKNTASLISLGGLVELATIAAGVLGFKTHCQLAPCLEEGEISPAPGQVWAQLSFQGDPVAPPVSPSERELYDTIPLRHTNRKNYQGGELPLAIEEGVLRNAKLISQELHPSILKLEVLTSEERRQLLNLMAQEEGLLFGNKALVAHILPWLRINFNQAHKTRDGMHLNQLPIKSFERPLFMLFYFVPSLLVFLFKWGLSFLIHKNIQETIGSSAAIIFYWGPRSSFRRHLFQVGKMAIRNWLYLQSQGYGVGPQTASTLLLTQKACDPSLPSELFSDESQRALSEEKLRQLRQLCGITQMDWVPYWAYRTGKVKPLPTEERSLRRDKNLFLKW